MNNQQQTNSNKSGGDGGEIFIAARKIQGNGKITADGGDGLPGGKGGKVEIFTGENNFKGEISAKGGNSLKEVAKKAHTNESNSLFQGDPPWPINKILWIWNTFRYVCKKTKRPTLTALMLVISIIFVFYLYGLVKGKPGFSYTSFSNSWATASTTLPTTVDAWLEGNVKNTFPNKIFLERVHYIIWKDKWLGSMYAGGYLIGNIYDLGSDQERKPLKLPILFEPNEAKHLAFFLQINVSDVETMRMFARRQCQGVFCWVATDINLLFEDSHGNIFDENGKIFKKEVEDGWWLLPNSQTFKESLLAKIELYKDIAIWKFQRFFHLLK